MQPKCDYDVTIVGGGMAGAALACSLSGKGLKIAVIESILFSAPEQPSYDDRGITLSLSSKRIFSGLKLWHKVEQYANPIEKIHVSEQGSFATVRLNAKDVNLSSLAFVVPAKHLGQCLIEQVQESDDIDYLCPAEFQGVELLSDHSLIEIKQANESIRFSSSLLVAADGSFSSIRQQAGLATRVKDYGQTAIVSNISFQKSLNNTAYERFTKHGPLAILPLRGNDAVCVYTVERNNSSYYMQCDEEVYAQQILKELGRRLGNIEKLGKRRSYPLRLVECTEQVKRGLIVLGNAAHTIHPNAAQGFNLALRDVAGLAECILKLKENNQSLSSESLQQDYLAMRETDQNNVIQFSDTLAELFYNDSRFKKLIRFLVMTGFEKIPFAKRELITRGMGITSTQPKLVRGLSL